MRSRSARAAASSTRGVDVRSADEPEVAGLGLVARVGDRDLDQPHVLEPRELAARRRHERVVHLHVADLQHARVLAPRAPRARPPRRPSGRAASRPARACPRRAPSQAIGAWPPGVASSTASTSAAATISSKLERRAHACAGAARDGRGAARREVAHGDELEAVGEPHDRREVRRLRDRPGADDGDAHTAPGRGLNGHGGEDTTQDQMARKAGTGGHRFSTTGLDWSRTDRDTRPIRVGRRRPSPAPPLPGLPARGRSDHARRAAARGPAALRAEPVRPAAGEPHDGAPGARGALRGRADRVGARPRHVRHGRAADRAGERPAQLHRARPAARARAVGARARAHDPPGDLRRGRAVPHRAGRRAVRAAPAAHAGRRAGRGRRRARAARPRARRRSRPTSRRHRCSTASSRRAVRRCAPTTRSRRGPPTRTRPASLEMPAGGPVLLAATTSFDSQGRILELARTFYRGDRYRFQSSLVRRR